MKLAGFQSRFRRQSDCASKAEGVGLGPTRPLAELGGFRNRCRRPTLGLPFHERMAQDSNLPTARAVTSGFQPGALPDQPAILERSMKDSNLRIGCPMYALAGRCRSRWANAP